MKCVFLHSLVALVVLLVVGCGQEGTTESSPVTATPETQAVPASQAAPPSQAAPTSEAPPAEKAVPVEPGAVPFDFPKQQTLAAKAGDHVLCPPDLWINKGFGNKSQTYIYYGATVVEPGELQSKIKRLSGSDMMVPNAMIVPLKSGQTANPGDVVLTYWQSGSGMQRAIVVPGGSPEAPNVRYLDLDLDNPSGVAQKVDTLEANTFHKITSEWELGTAVACKSGTRYRHGLIANITDTKVLTLGFAGRMEVVEKAACVPIPVNPKVKSGQQVWVESMGGMTEGVVKRIDTKIGRIFVEYQFGGQTKEVGAPVGDVATKALP